MLTDMKGVKSTSADAGQYLTAIGLTFVKASALVTGSPLKRALGNFLLFFGNRGVPTRVFTSESEAEDWLMKYT